MFLCTLAIRVADAISGCMGVHARIFREYPPSSDGIYQKVSGLLAPARLQLEDVSSLTQSTVISIGRDRMDRREEQVYPGWCVPSFNPAKPCLFGSE